MVNLLDSLEKILLMGPGPSTIHDSVYTSLSKTTLGHLDPSFIEIMDTIMEQLRELCRTRNQLTIPISGTGSAGMETCFVNLIEPGDRILILSNGVFGARMQDVATRLRAAVDVLDFAWGTPVVVETVKKQVEQVNYKIVAVVHAETSTGVANPVAEISKVLDLENTIYLVDTVTSLGGMPVAMDEWGIDVLYSGTQKCLSCPPGLAPVSFSEKAVSAIRARKNKVPNWYLDLTLIMNYWEGQSRVYHHTAPINMLYGLYQALTLLLSEGLQKVFQRHLENHRILVAGLQEMGLKMLVETPYQLPMLNSVCIPGHINDVRVRTELRRNHAIEIGAGLGPLAGKIWRIGLMGHTARKENVNRFLQSLHEAMKV